jgi:transposase-like protein
MPRRGKYRLWSAEEKRSICRQTRAPGVSVAQVARRYALNANLICKWLKDPRFAAAAVVEEKPVFLPVEVREHDAPTVPMAPPAGHLPQTSDGNNLSTPTPPCVPRRREGAPACR